ncbi:hypothetical protein NL676_030590 [Syzygium grande]|nr:hypothetical protein NL676_030590 [Syzygium grande]
MGGEKELWTLEITMISAMDDVCLIISLRRPEQAEAVPPRLQARQHEPLVWPHLRLPLSTRPRHPPASSSSRSRRPTAPPSRRTSARSMCRVRDLLVKAGPGDVKLKVLSYEVSEEAGRVNHRLSSCKGAARLKFGCHVLATNPQGSAAVAVAAASGMCDGGISVGGISAGGIFIGGISAARISIGEISAGAYPQATWGYRPNTTPNCGYLPPTGYPAPAALPATYPPPMPGAAPYLQTVYTPNAASNYPLQGYMNPSVGYEYAAPPPHVGRNFMRTAYLPNATPTYGYPPPANMHPPAGYGLIAPVLHAGGNFLERVTSRVTADVIVNWLNDPGNNVRATLHGGGRLVVGEGLPHAGEAWWRLRQPHGGLGAPRRRRALGGVGAAEGPGQLWMAGRRLLGGAGVRGMAILLSMAPSDP